MPEVCVAMVSRVVTPEINKVYKIYKNKLNSLVNVLLTKMGGTGIIWYFGVK